MRPGLLQSMGSQRVRHDWATELNWIIKKTHMTFWLLIGKICFPKMFSKSEHYWGIPPPLKEEKQKKFVTCHTVYNCSLFPLRVQYIDGPWRTIFPVFIFWMALTHLDPGLGHLTYSGRFVISKSDTSRGLSDFYELRLIFSKHLILEVRCNPVK